MAGPYLINNMEVKNGQSVVLNYRAVAEVLAWNGANMTLPPTFVITFNEERHELLASLNNHSQIVFFSAQGGLSYGLLEHEGQLYLAEL
jgi:hypothetical protein